MGICEHNNCSYLHENAPAYCDECGSYVDGDRVFVKGKKYLLKERKIKMDKILQK